MKYLFSIFLLVFQTSHLSAQEEEKILSACQHFDYTELESVLNGLKKKAPKKYDVKSKLDREFFNGFFEQILELKIDRTTYDYLTPFTFKYEIYLLKKKDGKIAYYKIVRLQEVEDEEGDPIDLQPLVDEGSDAELEALKIDYFQTFCVPLDFNWLFETRIEFEHYTCIGPESDHRNMVDQMVTSNSADELITWLGSPVLEIQLYAIDGILALKDFGTDFDPSILELIELISKKEATVEMTYGCLVHEESVCQVIDNIKRNRNFRY